MAPYRAMHAALERARTGGGPSIVEAKCYRYLSHSTDDDDRSYRSRDEIEAHHKLDPVPRFEEVLIQAGVLDAAAAKALPPARRPQAHGPAGARPAAPEPTP